MLLNGHVKYKKLRLGIIFRKSKLFQKKTSLNKTTLSTGVGECTTYPRSTTQSTYYCSGTSASPSNCNNFGSTGSGGNNWSCYNPSTGNVADPCSTSQWQCAVMNYTKAIY